MKRLVAALAGVLLVAGCTGVPRSSAPQTLEQVRVGEPSPAASDAPPRDAAPRTIVINFLLANAADPSKNTSARAYLTAQARSQWSDAKVTIVDQANTDIYYSSTHTVTTYGHVVGTVDARGIYTPTLLGQGLGGPAVPFTYKMATVDGQSRINSLRSGMLLTQDQFRSAFEQYPVYFYDLAEDQLVPDPRWTAIDDKAQLAQWLMTQLVTGPGTDLQNSVATDTLPAQADPQHVTVSLGSPTTVEIPGSSQLAASVRNRLAAQVSETLVPAVSGGEITITDGGKPVEIAKVGGTQFSSADFTSQLGPAPPAAHVYYLSDGKVYTEDDRPLAGPLGSSTPYLDSVAVSQPDATGALLAAGVVGSGKDERLVVGNASTGVKPTTLTGVLTRPAFCVGRRELWIGDGPAVYRLTVAADGTVSKPAQVQLPKVSGGGRVVALRPSPDGSRIAIVVAGASDASAELYVGSIVRGSGQVRFDSLQAISPEDAVVTDVGWLDPLTLYAIGSFASTGQSRFFDTSVDGSQWTNRTIGNLTYPPDSVTATAGAPEWVSEHGFVWRYSAQGWAPPGAAGQTPGRAPVYLQ